MSSYTFKQADRIKSSDHFNSFFSQSKKIVSKYFIIFYSRKTYENQKFAFIASKKVGHAVFRNRAKRRLREIVRQLTINLDYDVVFVAKKNINFEKYKTIQYKLIECLKTVNIY